MGSRLLLVQEISAPFVFSLIETLYRTLALSCGGLHLLPLVPGIRHLVILYVPSVFPLPERALAITMLALLLPDAKILLVGELLWQEGEEILGSGVHLLLLGLDFLLQLAAKEAHLAP